MEQQQVNEKIKPKNTRWRLVKICIVLSTFAFFVPNILNFVLQFFMKDFQPLSMLDAGSWVAVITIVLGMYKISNVAQDHIFAKKVPKEDPPLIFEEEDEGD